MKFRKCIYFDLSGDLDELEFRFDEDCISLYPYGYNIGYKEVGDFTLITFSFIPSKRGARMRGEKRRDWNIIVSNTTLIGVEVRHFPFDDGKVEGIYNSFLRRKDLGKVPAFIKKIEEEEYDNFSFEDSHREDRGWDTASYSFEMDYCSCYDCRKSDFKRGDKVTDCDGNDIFVKVGDDIKLNHSRVVELNRG